MKPTKRLTVNVTTKGFRRATWLANRAAKAMDKLAKTSARAAKAMEALRTALPPEVEVRKDDR